MEIKILSWNVNGIRAVERRGFLSWLQRERPEILCLQETKSRPEQLNSSIGEPAGYHTYWSYPQDRAYSGVALFSKQEPINLRRDFGTPEFDMEGRLLMADYPGFTLLNVYFPNGKRSEERLRYKLNFYDRFLDFVESLRKKGERLVICGDFNTAHKEIDIARPKANEKFSGFLPIERAWMDKFVARGYVDTFRHFHSESGQYTFWDVKTGARERNVGWRIDYFFVTENLLPNVAAAFIRPEVMGSDHCPIGVRLELDWRLPD